MNRIFTFIIGLFLFSLFQINHASAQTTCNCWPTRDTSFHAVPFVYDSDGDYVPTPPYYRCDDGVTSPIVLPFHFCFWGREMDTIFINTNGNLSFFQPYSGYVPDTFPITNYSMIAPFWADVDTRVGNIHAPNITFYQMTAHHLLVQWDSVRYYDCTDPSDSVYYNSFEVVISDGTDPIIPKGNNVEFCYKKMVWTTGDASFGTNGYGGDPATVGANQGDAKRFIQMGLFDTAGSKYYGQYPPAPSYDGVYWLDNKSFIFNLCSGTIAPLVSGVTPCDTFRICLGDSLSIPLYFFSPTQGDTVWSNLSPPVPSGVTTIYNNPGPTDSMLIKIVGNSFNLGFHTINVYGWDNQVPPDTTYTSFVIEVDTAPNMTVTAINDTICLGDTATLTASGAKLYLWSTGATTSSIKVSPATTQLYSVGGSDGGCDASIAIQVVVLPTPVAKIKIKKDTVCPKDSVLLIGSGGGSYKWNTGKTTDSIWVIPTTTTSYTLNVSNGRCTDSTTISIYVTTPGTSMVTIATDSICPYTRDTITASGGTAYKWNTGETTDTIIVAPGTTTTYTVMATVTCAVDTLKQKVNVIPLPVPDVKGRTAICKTFGDTITISGGTSYVWSDGSTSTEYILKNIYADSTISVELFNGKCHVDTTIHILIKTPPTDSISPPAFVCAGYPVLLEAFASGSGPFTYQWSPGGKTTDTITVFDSTKTTYTVKISNGCLTSKSTTVTPDLPPLNACCSDTILLGKDTMITAGGKGIVRYSWTPNTGLNCDTCPVVIASPSVTTTYTVLGTDSLGCQAERVVTIVVEIPCFNITVPNVITPDYPGQMGVNNEFYIKTQNMNGWALSIYDRWGKEMFKTNNPDSFWTGVTESGDKAPDGVYYYILSGTCQKKTYNKDGFLQLIR